MARTVRGFKAQVTVLDGNDDSEATDAFDLAGNRNFAVNIATISGGVDTFVTTVQQSFDGEETSPVWLAFATPKTISGVGTLEDQATTTRHIRVRVSTAQGGVASIRVRIHSKP